MKAETLANYEDFALAYVANPTREIGALYRKVVDPRAKKSDATSTANNWLREGHAVAKRIAELQAVIRARAEAFNAEAEENGTLPTFLSVEEKRKVLAEYVRFEPENYDKEKHAHILCGVKKTQFGTNLEFPNKLAAIKLDNDLAGDGAQAKGANSLNEALLQLVSKLRK